MENNPFFSVITITRNNRQGLIRTAKSVTEQTYPDYEWIIIDGASEDGSTQDFGNYTRARITSEPDKGIYDAMNKGIGQARGKYLIFMNAGDTFAGPDSLWKTKDAIANNTYDLVYGDSYEENGTLFLKPAKPHTTIEHGMFTHHQAMFYNRESLGTRRYDTNYKISADYDLTLRFLKDGPRNCLNLPFPVCTFESGGISQRNVRLGREEQFHARKSANVPLLKNWMITQKQKAASLVRRFCPSLHRYMAGLEKANGELSG